MTMPTKKTKKPKPPRTPHVATHLPADANDLETRCNAIWAAVQADTVHFPTASVYPPAPQINADLAGLKTALQEAEGGDPVAIVALRVAADKVRADFRLLGAYIDSVVRSGSLVDAPAIIAAVLLYESKVGTRPPKPELAAKQGESGTVALIALAVASALVYYFEFSADQATWTAVPQTPKTRAAISGLTPGKVYYFRFRAFTRQGGMGPYSQVVSLMVI
jgi:hypothetical protein